MIPTVLLIVFVVIVFLVLKAAAQSSSKEKPAEDNFEIKVTVARSGWSEKIKNPSKPEDVWIPPGQDCRIGRFQIQGGMLYLGSRLPSVSGFHLEPSLINPKLKISDRPPPCLSERLMNYWPSYSEISPAARAAYLSWLAGGKTDPDVDVGYVFLYFYGLERRVLADAESLKSAQTEIPALLAEIERLLSLYRRHDSFCRYANGFLSLCRADTLVSRKLYDSAPPTEPTNWEMPVEMKVGLGQLVSDRKPVPADWAFAWMKTGPTTNLRTPATRCPNEFERLFKLRYTSKYGEGLKIRPNKTQLSLNYHPASGSFCGSGWSRSLDLPDVSVLTSPLNKLQEITSECCDDLAAYSRLIGRDQTAKGSLAALALLPDELATESSEGKAGELKELLQDVLETSSDHFLKAEHLLCFWPSKNPGKLAKREAVQFIQLLERWGFGLEPDVRFGGKPPAAGDGILVFRLDDERVSVPSRQYSAATLVMHLAAMVSGADGQISDEEEHHLEGHLESALSLSGAERNRLKAHVKWLLTAQPGFAGTKKKLESLGEHQRTEVGRFLVSVACADGRIDPEEVKILTRAFKMMGFPETTLHGQLHEAMSLVTPAATEPVKVRSSSQVPQGYSIPKQPQETQQATISLDMKRIQNTLTETAAVSALLGEIFTDDTDQPPAEPKASVTAIAGLDEPHSELLKSFGLKASWPRVELENRVDDLGLMLDGALEVINEAAYEITDLPLCDGNDPIDIDHEILQEMMK